MVLKECMLIENDCYKSATKIVGNPTGIVVHSTGCNNRYIKRYVNRTYYFIPQKGSVNMKKFLSSLIVLYIICANVFGLIN